MTKIRGAIDIPLSADEGVMTLQDARNLIQAEAVDIFSIKAPKMAVSHLPRLFVSWLQPTAFKCFLIP